MTYEHTHKDAPDNFICEDCGKPYYEGCTDQSLSDKITKKGNITAINVREAVLKLKLFPFHCEECKNNLHKYIDKIFGEKLI
jgi:hypothetical protein